MHMTDSKLTSIFSKFFHDLTEKPFCVLLQPRNFYQLAGSPYKRCDEAKKLKVVKIEWKKCRPNNFNFTSLKPNAHTENTICLL